MKCPVCTAWASVVITRQRPDGTTRRRYECANLHRFSTLETIARADPGKLPPGRPKPPTEAAA